jgi:hypothetical protein
MIGANKYITTKSTRRSIAYVALAQVVACAGYFWRSVSNENYGIKQRHKSEKDDNGIRE